MIPGTLPVIQMPSYIHLSLPAITALPYHAYYTAAFRYSRVFTIVLSLILPCELCAEWKVSLSLLDPFPSPIIFAPKYSV